MLSLDVGNPAGQTERKKNIQGNIIGAVFKTRNGETAL